MGLLPFGKRKCNFTAHWTHHKVVYNLIWDRVDAFINSHELMVKEMYGSTRSIYVMFYAQFIGGRKLIRSIFT